MVVADIQETYRPYGGNSQLFTCRHPEILLSGPAGTGKSRGALEFMNYASMTYPGARSLMLRKTRRSLSESGMVTLEKKVLHPAQGVRFHSSKQQYQYPNGSIIGVGGMDKPSKLMSSEWDIIYFMEAIEAEEDDWESCTVRIRNGVTPFQLMIGDTNPGQSIHWLLERARNGKMQMLETRHEDNPTLFNRDGTMTPEGERYLSKLDNLTGVRYARYRLGLWVSAEGMVYEDSWDHKRNVIDPFPIPAEWPRYLWFDFGFTHPFVCHWVAQDPDGRLYVYREIYMTKRLVEDHCKDIKKYSRWGEKGGDPLPRALIADHDAEGRATLERHLGLRTMPAHKAVSEGIQAMASRLRPSGDGKARLMYFRNLLVERDRELVDAKLPTSVIEEPESYVWDLRQGAKKGDQPMKEYDHGMDTDRYGVAYFDLRPREVAYSRPVY